MLWNNAHIMGQPRPQPAAQPSPGPWEALADQPNPSGAILIQDADGQIVGWATDHAGHTTEWAPPDGRSPAEIAANARLMGAAAETALVCELLSNTMPLLESVLARAGAALPPDLGLAASIARSVLARRAEAPTGCPGSMPTLPAVNDNPTRGTA